jgi:hypothetical protein
MSLSSSDCDDLEDIKNNNPRCKEFSVGSSIIEKFNLFLEALKVNTILKKLSIYYIDCFTLYFKPISEVLKKNTNITSLYIRDNEITSEGIVLISELLKTNKGLKEFVLHNNEINTEPQNKVWFWIVFTEALQLNKSITKLSITSIRLQVEEVRVISKILENNDVLTELDMSGNDIDCEGVKFIARALKSNTKLKELRLEKNLIDTEGYRRIAKALKTNKSLVTLKLQNNKPSVNLFHFFLDALKTNRSLKHLYLDVYYRFHFEQALLKLLLERNSSCMTDASFYETLIRYTGIHTQEKESPVSIQSQFVFDESVSLIKLQKTIREEVKKLTEEIEAMKQKVDRHETLCIICLRNQKNCVFLPCGHLYTCMKCSKDLITCPICREVVKQKVRVFM